MGLGRMDSFVVLSEKAFVWPCPSTIEKCARLASLVQWHASFLLFSYGQFRIWIDMVSSTPTIQPNHTGTTTVICNTLKFSLAEYFEFQLRVRRPYGRRKVEVAVVEIVENGGS